MTPFPCRLVLAASLLLQACAGEQAEAPAPVTPAGTPLGIAPEPRIAVGVLEGDPMQTFDQVRTPFVMADGRLVVPLYGMSEIRVFAPDGSYQATLGGLGQGPGEFQGLRAAWARGDTIEAFDVGRGNTGPGLRRIIRFLPDDSDQTIVLTGGGLTDAPLTGPAGEGWALLRFESAGGGRRDQMTVQRFGRDGAHVGEVATLEGFLRQTSSTGGGGPGPLSPRGTYRVHDGSIYLGDTYQPSIRIFGPAGDSTRFRWDPGTPPDLNATLATVIDAAVGSGPAERAETQRQYLEGFPPPQQVSVFWDFLVDDRDFVWIRPFDPTRHGFGFAQRPGSTLSASLGGTWTIISPEGVTVGSVVVPDDFEPTQITDDAVVGIARDELGVERVRVYALERR